MKVKLWSLSTTNWWGRRHMNKYLSMRCSEGSTKGAPKGLWRPRKRVLNSPHWERKGSLREGLLS